MHSQLAATASLPFSAPGATPQAAPLCAQGVPSTANHSTLCQGGNTRAAGAHCKGSKPQVCGTGTGAALQSRKRSTSRDNQLHPLLQPPAHCFHPSSGHSRDALPQGSAPSTKGSADHPLQLLPNHCKKKKQTAIQGPTMSPPNFFQAFLRVGTHWHSEAHRNSPVSGFPLRSF